MKRPIIGMTVSVQFASLLKWIVPANIKHFEKWYIITSATDRETHAISKELGAGIIEIVHFDFQSGGSLFNKGGALGSGQMRAHHLHPEAWYLILDADILLPSDFRRCLAQLEHRKDLLYGVEARYDYTSVANLQQDICDVYRYGKYFTGFFQLYADVDKYYHDSKSIDQCDNVFRDQFSDQQLIDGLFVKHLGSSGIGKRYLMENEFEWDGQMQDSTFAASTNIDLRLCEYSIGLETAGN